MLKKIILTGGLVCSLALAAFYLKPHHQAKENSNMSEDVKKTLVITDQEIGTGAVAQAKKIVRVHYKGTLEDGTEFDNSFKRGEPIQFELGVGQVIKGWDDGLLGMKVGGKRRLWIPSHMGYGARGAGHVIPPHSNLILDVELVDVLG